MLAYEPKRERLDARVMVAAEGEPRPGELALLRETVVVELGERHLDDLLTIADPLVVTDLPTLLWSPHGHHEIVAELLALAQVDAARLGRGAERARRRSTEHASSADAPMSSTSPGCARHRGASASRRASTRRRCDASCARSLRLTVRHHPASTAAAMLLAGWLGSRLEWKRRNAQRAAAMRCVGEAQRSRQDCRAAPAGRTGADWCRASRA